MRARWRASAMNTQAEQAMLNLIKLLIVLLILGVIGIAGYAYLGDMAPRPAETRVPVDLNAGN